MRQTAATTASIRSQRMSRTIKAKRYNTLAACIRRSIWNDIAYPLAVDRRCAGVQQQRSRKIPRRGARRHHAVLADEQRDLLLDVVELFDQRVDARLIEP